jgi:hypothetical protein
MMFHRNRLLFALASLLAGLGASKSQAKAEGLTVSQPEPQGTLSVAPAQPQPTVEVAPANTSSTPLPVASEPAPAPAAAPAAELQPAANPQPAAPAPETPAPAAPTPAEAAQPAATPQTTATVSEVQPATGVPAESPPPSIPEASPTATISQPASEPAQPALEVAEPQATPQMAVQTEAQPAPTVTVTNASPPAGPLTVSQPQSGATQVTGQELQGGPAQAPSAASPPAQPKAPTKPLQGSSPNIQGGGSHGAADVQPTTAPQEITANDKADLPPANGGTTNAQPPKQADHICTTATFHDLIGGGFRYCTGPSSSLVLIAGVGEGGGVSVDREPADASSPTLHGELSIGDGLASGGVSGDLPLHGPPSIGANAGVLGYGPNATVTRASDGSPAAQLGLQGPLSAGNKNGKPSKSKSSQGAKADAFVDVEVPLSWRYIQPDTLISPLRHNLYFGL